MRFSLERVDMKALDVETRPMLEILGLGPLQPDP